MVYCGRPSTACHTCRRTRLKCDRIQTGCSQCARKGLKCPGYRDAGELRLVNQTDSVTRRARKAQKTAKGKSRQGDATHQPKPVSLTEKVPFNNDEIEHVEPIADFDLQLQGHVMQAVEDAALTYFMSSYITCSPFYLYLPRMYAQGYLIDDALSTAISAGSLATFAMRVKNTAILQKAQNRYLLALSRTNTALADPEESIRDRTLATVLLLGNYESVVFPGRRAPKEWTAHCLGALRLLQLRGIQQFESEFASQLFAHTANNVRASCIARHVMVPEELIRLSEEVRPFLNPADSGNRLGPVLNKFSTILNTAHEFKEQSDAGKLRMLQEAVTLDKMASRVLDQAERELAETVSSKFEDSWTAASPSLGSPTQYRTAKFCNGVHMSRLYLNHMIRWWACSTYEHMNSRSPANSAESETTDRTLAHLLNVQSNSASNCIDLAAAILATVPIFFEPTQPDNVFSPAARTLIWPLNIVYSVKSCPDAARETARTLLCRIGEDLGFPQLMDPALDDEDSWLLMYHMD